MSVRSVIRLETSIRVPRSQRWASATPRGSSRRWGSGWTPPLHPLSVRETDTGTSGNVSAASMYLDGNPTATSAANYYAQNLKARTESGGTEDYTGTLAGIMLQSTHRGSGTVDDLYGANFVATLTGTGTINTAAAARYAVKDQGGTIANGYGILIDQVDGTSAFGVYVDVPASNYFQGNVGIGTTTPGQELDVAGNIELNGVLYMGADRFLHNHGAGNTFVGASAGNLTLTGTDNTAVGFNALTASTFGYDNTAIGRDALRSVTGSCRNTGVGIDALELLSNGSYNTAVGRGALSQLTDGAYNIALGESAGTTLTNGSANIYIGNSGQASESNIIRIGSGSQIHTYLQGPVTIENYTLPDTDGTSGQVLATNGSGTLSWTTVVGGGSGWSLTGNAGTTPGVNFLGTTDNQALQIHANSARVLRLEPPGLTSFGSSPNVIGGEASNFVWSSAYGCFIGGGGVQATPNRIYDSFCVIGGGANNIAGTNDGFPETGWLATIGGGSGNTAEGICSFIGGGAGNYVDQHSQAGAIVGGGPNTITGTGAAHSSYSFIGGGYYNDIESARYSGIGCGDDNYITLGDHNYIGGGDTNSILEGSDWATIGGGLDNHITYNALPPDAGSTPVGHSYATIGGGVYNRVCSEAGTIGGGDYNYVMIGADMGTIAGGELNTVSGTRGAIGGGSENQATGSYSTVPGGAGNVAGADFTFAAGLNALALLPGNFVWADTNALWGPPFPFPDPAGPLMQDQFWVRAGGGTYFVSSDPGGVFGGYTGVWLPPGAVAWNVLSDRALKENFTSVDTQDILDRVAGMPILQWNLKSQDESIPHVGPVAQDFHAAFGLGESARHINSSDIDGVALAAIQGLYELLQAKDAELDELRASHDDLIARLDALEEEVAALK